MPVVFEGFEVHAQPRGNGGYIKFTHDDNLAASMGRMPNIVKLEYGSGYALFGMQHRYTIRMRGAEFLALIGEDDWSLYQSASYERQMDGTIVHHAVADWHEIEGLVTNDIILDLPPRIQKEAGRGTEINLRSDQLRVLDH
jgi:hypothetical protein